MMVKYIQLVSHDNDSTYDNPSMHTEILRLDETIREVYIRKTFLDRAEMVVSYNTGNLVITLDEKDVYKCMEHIYRELLKMSDANNIERNKD